MHIISKEIEGDFGHRVWTQKLEEEFACTTSCKCKAIHGHRFKIVPEIASDKGLEHGRVTDFSHLAAFKNWVDEVIDHKLLMDIKDPVLGQMFPKMQYPLSALLGQGLLETGYLIKPPAIEDLSDSEKEIYEGLTIVDFVPTAENICKWLAVDVLPRFLPKGIYVKNLTFYETPKSYARWEN